MKRFKLLAAALLAYVAPASAQITGRGEYGLDAILNVLAAIVNLIYIGPAGRLGPNDSIAFLLVLGFLFYILNQFIYLTWVMVRQNVKDSRGIRIDEDFDNRYTASLSAVLALIAVQVLWPVGFGIAILIGLIGMAVFLLRFSGIIGGTAGEESLGAEAIDRADRKRQERESETSDVEQTQQEVEKEEETVEDLEQEAREDLEKGDEEEAEKKAEIAYKELYRVAMLLIGEERTISHLAELESEELEEAIEIGRKVRERNQQVEDILDELDEELGAVIYESLARTFRGDRTDRVFKRMIEEYLENPEELREDLEDGVFAVASDQDPRDAEQLLQQAENTLEEDLEIEEINFAEIKSVIEDNREVLEDFKRLKQEIETAVSEDRELEKIMEELGKREEIEDLHQRIEQIREGFLEAKKRQEALSEIESQLEGMEDAGDEFDRIQRLIERKNKREAVLDILKKKLDSQGTRQQDSSETGTASFNEAEIREVKRVLLNAEQEIEEAERLEEEQLREAYSLHSQTMQRVEKVEQQLNQTINPEIRSLLQNEGVSSERVDEYFRNPEELQQDIQNSSLTISNSQAVGQLEQQLSSVEEELQRDISGDYRSYREVLEVLQENRQVFKTFLEAERKIKDAVSFTDDLRKILEAFSEKATWQDLGLQYEQDTARLASRFLEANRKLREIEEVDRQIKQAIEDGETEEIAELEREIEKIEEIIGLLEEAVREAAEGGTGATGKQAWDFENAREWREILDNPNQYIQAGGQLVSYNQQRIFSYPVNGPNYPLPHQGFKLHVSAYPPEGFEVVKAFVPVLQDLGLRHKIFHSLQTMESRKNRKGREDLQIKKFITIYPKIQNPNLVFTRNPQSSSEADQNRNAMYANYSETVDTLRAILSNTDSNILGGGPPIEGERDKYGMTLRLSEKQVGDTRITIKYDHLGSGSVQIDSQSLNDYASDPANYRQDFLSHLLPESQAENVKNTLLNRRPDRATIGEDGLVAGAYYLPPPEVEEKVNQIIDSVT